MKFRCHKETLLKEISIAQEIISSKNSFSILSNIYLVLEGNNLEIKSTDMKVSFKTVIPVQGNEDGETKIYCDKFIGIIRNFPDEEIIFEKDNNEIVVRNNTNKINYNLKSIAKEEYPEFKTISDSNYFSIAQSDFIQMINQTLFAISDDETRYFMNGVYLEKNESGLTMVATDGRRLSIISKIFENEIPDFEPIIIPPKILNLVKKISVSEGELNLAIFDNTLYIKINDSYFYSNLIEGQFPNYKRVIPEKQEQSFTFNKLDVLSALKRVDLLVEKNSKKIFMDIQTNSILLSSDKSDFGEAKESIGCNYEGDQIILALNSHYLEEPLRVINSDEVEIQFTSMNKAITIYPIPKKDYFHIVMPMQNN